MPTHSAPVASRALPAEMAPAAAPYCRLQFATGVEYALSRSDVNDLANASVNAISRRGQGGLQLRAWFPLGTDVDYPTLAVRDLLNVISADLQDLLADDSGWRTIDGHGWQTSRVKGICTAYLETIRGAGGLYERFSGATMLDPGYLVDVGPDVNTLASLSAGELHVRVGIRPAPHAALVIIDIVKVGLSSSL
jgi:phage tail sheath protein FI